jgi:FKBP-type peptidyl-prolyl cis-trans isomerase 2
MQKIKELMLMAEKKAKKAEKGAAGAKAAAAGSKVQIDYVGSFEDGRVFDASSRHGKPIEFVVGSGQVIPGFDTAVTGMKVGEEKTFRIEPKDGYGEHKDELVKILTRDKLPPEHEPKEGMVLVLGLGNGVEIPALITKVNGQLVTIDMNHPLAGKALSFKIKLVGVE